MEKININDENLSEKNKGLPSEEIKLESGLLKRKKLLGDLIRKGLDTYGDTKRAINTLMDKIRGPNLEKQEQQKQKEIRERYEKTRSENSDRRTLFYNSGDGVKSLSSLPEKWPDKEWKTRAIEAQRFIDCCAVIFQSKSNKGIGVVHISPYAAFGGEYAGGPDLDISMSDVDYEESISRTIRELTCERIIDDVGGVLKERPKWLIDKKHPDSKFIQPEEKEQARKDLKAIIIGGHKDLQKILANQLRDGNYLLRGLQIDPKIYDYGTGEKNIFITNDQIFIEDKTNKKIYEPFKVI